MTTLDKKALAAALAETERWGADADHWSIVQSAIDVYLDALSSLPAQAVGATVDQARLEAWKAVVDAGGELADQAEHTAIGTVERRNVEAVAQRLAERVYDYRTAINRLSSLAPSQPAAVGVTDEMVERFALILAQSHAVFADMRREDNPLAPIRANDHARVVAKRALEAALRSTP